MSFVLSRVSTLGLLLSAPLLQAVACSSPSRDFAVEDETGGMNAQTGGRSGGASQGGAKQGGQGGQGGKSVSGGSGGEATSGVGPGGEAGTPGGSEGGDVGAAGAGGAPDAGAGGTLSGGTGGVTAKGGSGGVQGTGGANGGGGGQGGVNTGGSGGKGGANTGGGGGKGGANTGGVSTGGVNTGGGGKGGANTGGIVGAGGVIATGGVVGTGGSGGTGGACTVTGAEVCGDAKDNDCNGHTDCITVSDVFPMPNGAAAGKDVMIVANAPAIAGYTFQCRSARGGSVADTVTWAACQTGANTRIIPRTTAESLAPVNDGLWTTQVRAVFPNGATSDPFTHTYYMHSSLHYATRCAPAVSDADFITAGRGYLNDAGVFDTTTVLRSPFIQLGFKPPVSTWFSVVAGQGTVKLASLRRRFVRSPDNKYLLIARNYSSSRSNVCDGLDLRTHDTRNPLPENHNNQYLDNCNVVLFNHAGSGICLAVTGGTVQAVKHANSYTPAPTYSSTADNFAWRKLLDVNRKKGGFVHFSPKCFVAGCTTTTPNAYFLPDKAQFPYY